MGTGTWPCQTGTDLTNYLEETRAQLLDFETERDVHQRPDFRLPPWLCGSGSCSIFLHMCVVRVFVYKKIKKQGDRLSVTKVIKGI